MFLWFSLDYFVLVLFVFVVLGLVSSVLRQDESGHADVRETSLQEMSRLGNVCLGK